MYPKCFCIKPEKVLPKFLEISGVFVANSQRRNSPLEEPLFKYDKISKNN